VPIASSVSITLIGVLRVLVVANELSRRDLFYRIAVVFNIPSERQEHNFEAASRRIIRTVLKPSSKKARHKKKPRRSP